MKYADGPTAQADVVIDAPIERVWELITDIELPARFSAEFLGAQWADETRGVGARFVGRNQHKAMGEWETVSFVSRYEPMRVFGWNVTDPDNPSSSWWFELEETDAGVRLWQRMRMGPAPSGLNMAIDAMPDKEERIIARRLEEHQVNMRATLDGIKELAEQP